MPFEPVMTDLSGPPSAEVTARVDALSPAPPPLAPENPSDARRRLDVLIADRDFGERLLAGNVEAKQEFDKLQKLAAEADIPAPSEEALFSTTTDGALPPRDVAKWAAGERDLGFGDTALGEILSGKPHTAEEVFIAKSLKARAFRDVEFVKALEAGNPDAVRRWKLWTYIIAGGTEDTAK
jgi:hypothetical protein